MTTLRGRPYFFMIRFRNLSAAALSRFAVFVASVELAPGKARTAALFKKPSEALEDAINHGRIAAVTARGFIEMQGGLPIVVDGR